MNDKTTSIRTRRRGQHMNAQEKKKAKEVFLSALADTANVRRSCDIAGVDHSTIYRWQEHDEEFSLKFKQANQDANWKLFGEAWNRATEGEIEYVVSAGKLVYGPDGQPLTIHKKSDRLLELLLKARLPEFRDKQQLDVNTTIANNAKDQEKHDAIMKILEDYPEAKYKIAEILHELDKTS